MAEKPFRILPRVTGENEHFWCGGREGELRFLRCQPCGTYVHPPAPLCPDCLGKDLQVEAVSGRASVLTFTLNHHPWVPAADHPYAIAIVEIDEQPGLRLMTTIVGCPAESVHVGMRVRAVFEEHADVFVPLFTPEGA